MERLPDDKGAVDTQRVGASTEAFQLRGHRLLELQQVKDRNVHVRKSVTATLKLDEDEEESFTLPGSGHTFSINDFSLLNTYIFKYIVMTSKLSSEI